MPKYKKVRCIALNIKPGTRDEGGNLVYLGSASAERDIRIRCEIMKNAVATAHSELEKLTKKPPPKGIARGAMNVLNADPVLTIFMAPEFYFRGADGAYPIEKISSILPELANTVRDAKYKDWLFVYGTAIGYRKIDETITKVAEYREEKGNSIITPDSITERDVPPKGATEGGYIRWLVQEYVKAGVSRAEKIEPDDFRLTLDTKEDLSWCNRVRFVYGRQAEQTEEFTIKSQGAGRADGKRVVTVGARTTPIEAGWTAELYAMPPVPQVVIEDGEDVGLKANVIRSSATGDGTIQVTLATAVPSAIGSRVSFTRTDGTETERFPVRKCSNEPPDRNTVLTLWNEKQKREQECPTASCACRAFVPGKSNPNACASCGHLHQKDPVRVGWMANMKRRSLRLSNATVRYTPGRLIALRRQAHDGETEVFNIALVQRGGPGAREILVYKQEYSEIDYLPGVTEKKKFAIHGEERTLVNTEQMGKGRQGKGGDISGEAVFDIDNCTVGLEICLDHGKGRLKKFYDGGGGKPKPQILLIPSFGMRIGWGPVCCQDKAIAFNVDGDLGASAVRVIDGTYGCDVDLAITSLTEVTCPVCTKFHCDHCVQYATSTDGTAAGACRKCGRNTLHTVYWCQVHNQSSFDPNDSCPTCGAKYSPYEEKLPKIGISVPKEAGPATVTASGLDWLSAIQKNYFLGKGEIVIYPEKPIPNT